MWLAPASSRSRYRTAKCAVLVLRLLLQVSHRPVLHNEFIGAYDNSAKNEFNPDPTKTVSWGEQATDEML